MVVQLKEPPHAFFFTKCEQDSNLEYTACLDRESEWLERDVEVTTVVTG